MSLKLLKQSMDILEEGLSTNDKKSKNKQQNNRSIQNSKKSRVKGGIDKTNVSRLEHERKNNLKDIKQELELNNRKAEENMKRLLALSQNTVKVADAEKIVKRAHKGRYVDIELPKVEQESIFTDEDFKKFEEEYFNS